MKNKQLWAIAGLAVVAHGSFAQTAERLKLSTATPAAGKTITFSYDTTGAALGGAPEALVYFQDNKDFPAADVTLTPDGKAFKGEFTVPAEAKSFFVKIYNGDKVDDNGGKGYLYAVHNGSKPVAGAYAMEAYVIQSGMGNYFAKIGPDKEKVASLYKQEFAAYPKSKNEFALNYLGTIAASKDAADQAETNAVLSALGKSNNEKDLITLTSWYARNRKTQQADSVSAIIKKKYPKGIFVKGESTDAFTQEKDAVKKEALLKTYVASNPENKDNAKEIETYRIQMAAAYLQAGNYEGFQKYAAQVKNKIALAGALNNVAWGMAEKGENLEQAAKYSKQSLDFMDAAYQNPLPASYQSVKQVKENNRANYNTYADTYAFILYKQGNYADALKYQQQVYDNTKYDDPEVSEHYALILAANRENDKAKAVIEKALKAGKGSPAMRTALKEIYTKEKGSEAGYDSYVATLDAAAQTKMREELAKTMVKESAPAFTLKDFDGKEVSLASLKGKVVVLDFWATWCGPCKASFPGMQMAVNKYKENPNVKFLFIDTWESGDNYVPGVKKFIADNKYTFHVLLDEKGADGRQSKVVSSFGVTGIPTKFIIDQNGDIRFRHVGFSGTSEGVLNEVSNMIDMLASPDAAKVTTEKQAAVSGK